MDHTGDKPAEPIQWKRRFSIRPKYLRRWNRVEHLTSLSKLAKTRPLESVTDRELWGRTYSGDEDALAELECRTYVESERREDSAKWEAVTQKAIAQIDDMIRESFKRECPQHAALPKWVRISTHGMWIALDVDLVETSVEKMIAKGTRSALTKCIKAAVKFNRADLSPFYRAVIERVNAQGGSFKGIAEWVRGQATGPNARPIFRELGVRWRLSITPRLIAKRLDKKARYIVKKAPPRTTD